MDRPERDDMRAADYVLGLMAPNETAFFERDMRNDPELARHVADWRERVAHVDDDCGDTPQAEMRRRILTGMNRRRAGQTPEAAILRNGALRIAAALAGLAAAAGLLGLLQWPT